jgi:hypothetical protein
MSRGTSFIYPVEYYQGLTPHPLTEGMTSQNQTYLGVMASYQWSLDEWISKGWVRCQTLSKGGAGVHFRRKVGLLIESISQR